MTIRLSTGCRNAMLGDTTHKGIKGALDSGFMNVYTGTQPASADTGATGTLLGTVTVNNDGVTGITWTAAASGVLAKNGSELWQFGGLAAGVAGWFRFYPAGGSPGSTSTTEVRVDGLIGTAGADANMSNTNVALSAVSTVDSASITMPAS